jgi:hypothetical protein
MYESATTCQFFKSHTEVVPVVMSESDGFVMMAGDGPDADVGVENRGRSLRRC